MKIAQESESRRKENIFKAFDGHQEITGAPTPPTSDCEVYIGRALVSDVSKNCVGFHLSDGRKLRFIKVSQQVTTSIRRLDTLGLELYRKGRQWHIRKIFWIASLLNTTKIEVHLSRAKKLDVYPCKGCR